MLLVAPSAGAWIEIYSWAIETCNAPKSLPPRERGLKYGMMVEKMVKPGRSLRGSVD